MSIGIIRRPKAPNNQPFHLRHAGHPLGADYDVDNSTGCWLWKWTVNSMGYAQIRNGGKTHYVHRIMASAPQGSDVRHNSDCPRNCINPFHLQVGTRSENMRDYVVDRKGGRRKLTDRQAADIRKRLGAGESKNALAREYGVNPWTITNIHKGKTYAFTLAAHQR